MKRYEYDGIPGAKYYVLSIWYDISKHKWGVPDKEFDAVFGCSDGAGTGFGQRDMDWAFADKESADAALKEARRIIAGRDGFDISLDEYEVEVEN